MNTNNKFKRSFGHLCETSHIRARFDDTVARGGGVPCAKVPKVLRNFSAGIDAALDLIERR